ncbi:ubiquitin-like protein ATG12 [Biomphalaria glabrata]|uniref:Ubiquitin-like protein ATG12 n=1 Tax=Biomphalaria glabrata TaxID=6526 RepID=A0A2C9KWP8_BIOGL|nr:ubiquitin-like protein ATG12 [Biomphalaria glabrata]KAI8731572.1 ubiquitin-like protein ATG12 [Biomphalaria glabrata]
MTEPEDTSPASVTAETSEVETKPESPQAVSSPDVKQKLNLKVDILLKPAGDAPIMKKKKWTVDRTKRICWVSDFIKKYIKMEPSESLFLYVNQSYAPSPDTDIGSIFDCFGSDGKLVLHYCKSQAWG